MIHGPHSPDKPTWPEKLKAQGPHDQPDMLLYRFPLRLTWVILAIIGVAVVNHAIHLLCHYQPKTRKVFYKVPGIPALMALMRSIAFLQIKPLGPFPLPSMQAIIICLAFAAATIARCFSLHPYYRSSFEWGPPPLAMRAGGMAAALFPFIFATALKINPISILTGISHAKLQVYHQNLARLFLFFGIVHTVPFIKQQLKDGGYQNLKAYFYSSNRYWSGTVAIVFIAWIVFSSTNAVRKLSYEFFVIQHVFSFIVVTVVLFIHVHKTINTHLWLWSAVAFWFFSLIGRTVLSLFAFGKFKGTKTQVEAQVVSQLTESDATEKSDAIETIRISVETPLRWSPGQHIYIRFPGLNPFQAHPFTILSLPSSGRLSNSTLVLIVRVHKGQTRKIFNRFKSEKDAEAIIPPSNSGPTLVPSDSEKTIETTDIEAAPKTTDITGSPKKADVDGPIASTNEGTPTNDAQSVPATNVEGVMTTDLESAPNCFNQLATFEDNKSIVGNIQNQLSQTGLRSTRVTALIDGPYGYSKDPSMFEHTIFIAGGTGANFVLPILLDLLRRMADGKNKILTQRISLTWTCRSSVMLGWFKPILDEIVSLGSMLEVQVKFNIHLSKNMHSDHVEILNHGSTFIHDTRPEISVLLEEEFMIAKEYGITSACVYSCGPESLSLDVTNNVARANFNLLRGRLGSLRDLSLDNESFGW